MDIWSGLDVKHCHTYMYNKVNHHNVSQNYSAVIGQADKETLSVEEQAWLSDLSSMRNLIGTTAQHFSI